MPIRKAFAALLLSSVVFCLSPLPSSFAGASPDLESRPTAALVASSETTLRPNGATELSPIGLAALVAAVWIPALVLLTRRRRQQHRSASN